MRIATVQMHDGPKLVVAVDGDYRRLDFDLDLLSLIQAGVDPRDLAVGDVVAGELAAPLQPGKIVAIGLNYLDHIRESKLPQPEQPLVFAKFPSSLTGPNDPIVVEVELTTQVDWEVELGVVMGRPVYRATPEEASAAIAGYTVINDVSMRDWQRRTLQWLAGKMFQHSTPAGPYLVTPDEVGDAADLEVRCEVDGAVMQQSRTSDLLFSPAQIVSYASQAITLRPGDLIATGTCGGVGDARKPPVYLQPGNLLRTWIEGLGECLNQCVPEKNS